MVVAWINARYFAERLARTPAQLTPRLSERDRAMSSTESNRSSASLGSALSASEAERARTNAEAAARLHDQATMLAGVVSDAIAQLTACDSRYKSCSRARSES